jgi:putative hydrolase of the HAD superfamily
MQNKIISTLFLDIGGVLLTNSWDNAIRKRTIEHFHLDPDFHEIEDRHQMSFDAYEEGKMTLDEYLSLVVFYKKRSFKLDVFKEFLFLQSQPIPEMIKMFKNIAKNKTLRTGTISNEGRELTIYRLDSFGLKDFIQFFICSCFVHFRKPDKDIYLMALDVGHVKPEQSLFIDDRKLNIEVASDIGMNVIHHTDIETTRQKLSDYGLIA